jgi:hypothetical protein
MLPSTIAMLVVGSQTGRLERRLGSKPPPARRRPRELPAFALLSPAHTEEWEIHAAMLLLGSGIGLAFAAMANRIIEKVGPGETGVATGMHTVMRTVGGPFGGAATASLLAGTALAGSGDPAGVLVGLATPGRRPDEALGPHAAGDPEQAASEPT